VFITLTPRCHKLDNGEIPDGLEDAVNKLKQAANMK
jgi:hypothetical protein